MRLVKVLKCRRRKILNRRAQTLVIAIPDNDDEVEINLDDNSIGETC